VTTDPKEAQMTLHSRRRRVGSLLAVLAVVGVIGTLAATASEASGSVSAAPYKILIITGIKTLVQNQEEAIAGATAAAQAINKAGGLKGRQVEIDSCNNQGTATGTIDCARQAAQGSYDDVMEYHGFTSASKPILDQANITRIGTTNVVGPDFFDRYDVDLGPPPNAYYSAPGIYLIKNQHKKRFAIVSLDIAAGLSIAQGIRAGLTAAGGKYVGTIPIPLTQTDLLPTVQQLKNLNHDIVAVVANGPVVTSLMTARQQLGLSALVAGSATAIPSTAYGSMPGGGSGLYVGQALPPSTDARFAPFRSQLAAAGLAGNPVNLDSVSAKAWLSTWAIARLCATIKTGSCTSQTLLAQTRKAKNINLFNILKWSPSAKGPAAYPYQTVGTAYVLEAANGALTLASKTPVDYYATLGIKPKK
jgi:ABC-type branched-subunit amino acid transport system substrate-binding protein